MPMRLERFWSNLNRQNLKRRLKAFYKWNVGRGEANNLDFVRWMEELNDWYEQYAKEEKEEKKDKSNKKQE